MSTMTAAVLTEHGGPDTPRIHDLRRPYLHNISLIGSSMPTRGHFTALLGTARSGSVQPVIAAHFPRGGHVGKIMISIS